jgi:DNA polymerase
MSRDDLAAHLAFFADLGVAGVSADPAWRARSVPDPVRGLVRDPEPEREAGGTPDAEHAPAPGVPQAGSPAVPGEDAPGGTMLPMIRADIGDDCTRCKLHTLGRHQVVFGVGNPNAELMFVGEAPGADEDMQGVPFVGKAGQLLTKIIEAINLTRDQVYIANVIKCRPPGNRNPEPDEVEQCEPFLFRQIDAIRPRVIVALGKFAAQSLLRSAEPISKLRGREFPFRDAILIPTFHPAYLLRNPSSKREVWDDMKRVRDLLAIKVET